MMSLQAPNVDYNPANLPPNFTHDFFIYPASIGTLLTGASGQTNFQVQADSDFEWIMTTCYGNLNGAAEPISDASLLPINIQISDNSSGRNLFNFGIPASMFAGNGKQPFILPVPRLFKSRTNVNVLATSFGAGTFNNILLAFIGRKIWQMG